MKIWFLGGCFPEDRIKEFIENSFTYVQHAANNFQWAFIKGLEIHSPELKIFTSPLLASYPREYKQLIVRSSIFSHNGISGHICVGFINLPIIKLFSKLINLIFYLLKQKQEVDHIIIYSVHSPYVLSALYYKHIHKNVKLTLIVPDLPEYMSSSDAFIYRLFKRIDAYILKKSANKIDGFVFITDYMKQRFEIKDKPWVRIEGIFDKERVNENIENTQIDNKKIILYTGTLDTRYGINNLLEAFKMIDSPFYQLWICGEGNTKDKVIELSKKDNRVLYFGQVTSDRAMELQSIATALINPRTPEGEYTKYSFPIKTMEYLATGTPTIMYMLPGIPYEYRIHLNIPEDESIKALKEKMVEVCDCKGKTFINRANDAKKFIFEFKNPKFQTKKIIEMLSNMSNCSC